MCEVELLVVLVPFVEREVDDPCQFETITIDEVQFFTSARAGIASELVELGRQTGNEEAGIAVFETHLRADRFRALFTDVLGNRTSAFKLVAFLAPEDIAETRLAFALRPGIHAVTECARTAGLGRNCPDFDLRIVGDHVCEDLEARTGEMLGHSLHFNRVAQIRLVRTIGADRIVIGNATELLRHWLAFGKLFEDAAHDWFHRFPYFFLGHEAHFEVELVELARQTVCPRVFVAEARRDLEVAVETGNHQKLFVLLRRLRQRVELAFMNTARHEEIARAFRRGSRQDRRGELIEADFGHAATHRGNDLGAAHDVLVQRFTAKVEETVLQADIFRVVRLAEYRQRQFLGSGQHFDFGCEDFDFAGRQIGIDRIACAGLHFTIDTDNPFAANGFGNLEGGRIGIGHDLGNAIMIAKIDEENAAMVTDAVNPSGKANVRTNVRLAKGCAGMAAVTVHDFCLWNNKSVLADGNALNSRGKAHFDRVLSSLHSLRVLVLNHLDVTCRQKTLCAY